MTYSPPRFIEVLLWLALLLALAGSLKHLAAIFAAIDGHLLMGWLQAIAIDAGLFALAYSIRVRKAQGRTARPIWIGLALFSAISIYGNLAYGLLATNGQLPYWMTVTKPYLLAASLPVLVLFLSELLSDNRHAGRAYQTENEQGERGERTDRTQGEQGERLGRADRTQGEQGERSGRTNRTRGEQTERAKRTKSEQGEQSKRPERTERTDGEQDGRSGRTQGEQTNRRTDRQTNRPPDEPTTGYQSTIFALLDRQPSLGPTEIAAHTGASKSTAAKWLAAWQKQKLQRNGASR